jgi:hypothetical protein
MLRLLWELVGGIRSIQTTLEAPAANLYEVTGALRQVQGLAHWLDLNTTALADRFGPQKPRGKA